MINNDPSIKQRKATDTSSSVWVDASAGTGKTKVLVDRVLRFLLQGCMPSKILCITFTKAAASEMQYRINNKLLFWSTCKSEQLVKELVNLFGEQPELKIINNARKLFFINLDDPYGLQILTIHSFCQKILSRFPLEANVSFDFTLPSELEHQRLLNSTIENFYTKLADDQELKILLSYLIINGYQPNTIMNNLKEIIVDPRFKKNISFCNIQEIKQNLFRYFDIGADMTIESIAEGYSVEYQKLDSLYNILRIGSASAQKTAINLKNIIDKNKFDLDSFELYYGIFFTKDNEKRKKIVTNKILEENQWVEHFITVEQERLEATKEKINQAKCCHLSITFTVLAKKLLEQYCEIKKVSNVLDFDDLIDKTKELFARHDMAWILFKLDEGIDHILVDESQDTSPRQWELILKIAEDFFHGDSINCNRTLFVVGDRKQSIYSFQGADPSLFVNLKHFFENKIKLSNQGWKSIALNTSFRSSQAILDFINIVFFDLFSDFYQEHKSFYPFNSGKIEIWDLCKDKKSTDTDKVQVPVTQILAEQIAEYIKNQLQNKIELHAKGRAIKANDFMILVQRRSALMYQIIRALKKHNVPVAEPDRIYLTKHIAIQDFISLIEFLLLPENNYELSCVLKSPFFNFSDDDLIALSSKSEKSIFNQLKYSSSSKYNDVYKELLYLHKISKYSGVYDLFAYMFFCKNYRGRIIERMGVEVGDILDEFINFIFYFDTESNNNLQELLEILKQSEIEIKRDLSAIKEDSVKIMTVHGAKGLQAPLVILPDTTYIPKDSQLLIWHQDDLNNHIPIYNVSNKIATKQIIQLQKRLNKACILEYYRLLYVALTRAENRIIICGVENKLSTNNSWYNKCSMAMRNLANSFTDGVVSYETIQKQKIIQSQHNNVMSNKNISCVQWLFNKIENELGDPDPISPSGVNSNFNNQFDNKFSITNMQNNDRYDQGNYMHKLLEILPQYPEHDWYDLINIIAKKYEFINQKDKLSCASLVTNIIKDKKYSDLWEGIFFTEIDISGKAFEREFNAKLDLLVILDKNIKIVDFKTDKELPVISKIPNNYLVQLKIYKKLVQNSFPKHSITTELIWVRSNVRMEISHNMLHRIEI